MDELFKGASEAVITATMGTDDQKQNFDGFLTWRRQRGAEGGWSLINVGGFQSLIMMVILSIQERMFVN